MPGAKGPRARANDRVAALLHSPIRPASADRAAMTGGLAKPAMTVLGPSFPVGAVWRGPRLFWRFRHDPGPAAPAWITALVPAH